MKNIVSKIKTILTFLHATWTLLAYELVLGLLLITSCTSKPVNKTDPVKQDSVRTEVVYNVKYCDSDLNSNITVTKSDTITSVNSIKVINGRYNESCIRYIDGTDTLNKKIDVNAIGPSEVTVLYTTELK